MYALLHSVPQPCRGYCWPMPPLETPGHLRASLGQSVVGSLLLFSWVQVHIRFCLCPPGVCFQIMYMFWLLYGGVNGELLQEDLCHTDVYYTQTPCPWNSPLLTHNSTGELTVLSQSLWGLWVLVHTRYVWALWASLAGVEFDSKHSFTTPTILLGLLPCPWTWGVSSLGHHQMVNTKIRLTIFFAAKDGKLYTVSKNKTRSWTVTQIMNSLLSNSDLTEESSDNH